MNDPKTLREIADKTCIFDRNHFADDTAPTPEAILSNHERLPTDPKLITRLRPRYAVALGYFEGYAKAVEDLMANRSEQVSSEVTDTLLLEAATYANDKLNFGKSPNDLNIAKNAMDPNLDNTEWGSVVRAYVAGAFGKGHKPAQANIGIVIKPPPPPPPPAAPPMPTDDEIVQFVHDVLGIKDDAEAKKWSCERLAESADYLRKEAVHFSGPTSNACWIKLALQRFGSGLNEELARRSIANFNDAQAAKEALGKREDEIAELHELMTANGVPVDDLRSRVQWFLDRMKVVESKPQPKPPIDWKARNLRERLAWAVWDADDRFKGGWREANESEREICKSIADAVMDRWAKETNEPSGEPNRWVRLHALREGAVFETTNGIRAVKSEYVYPNGGIQCTLVASGEYAHFGDTPERHNDVLVREIVIYDRQAPPGTAGVVRNVLVDLAERLGDCSLNVEMTQEHLLDKIVEFVDYLREYQPIEPKQEVRLAPTPIVFRDDDEREYWDSMTFMLARKGDTTAQSVASAADEMVEERRARMPNAVKQESEQVSESVSKIDDGLLHEAAMATILANPLFPPIDMDGVRVALKTPMAERNAMADFAVGYIYGALRKARRA